MKYLTPTAPIWGQAFRPMFLLGALFSALAVAVWGVGIAAMVNGSSVAGLPQYGTVAGNFWHAHEMLFGFAAAIVAGFLLTAVQNWSGQRAINGKALLVLTLVWLAGRVLMLLGSMTPWWLTALVDMAFLPMVAWYFFKPLHAVKQSRNYFFSVAMLVMTLMNAVMHWGNHTGDLSVVYLGGHAMSLMIVFFVTVIGGRVMPMFTANGSGTPRVPNIEWLDKAVAASTLLFVVLFITSIDAWLPGWLMAVLCVLAGALQAVRIFRLRLSVTWKFPLLWSLHLAYWFIAIGFFLLAVHYLDGGMVSFSTALHALTVGAIGGMILSMISRVSMGHSGRPLQPHKVISLGFVLVLLAALIRSVGTAVFPALTLHLYCLSALLWTLAFLVFVFLYFKILTTPRPDGRPG